MSINNIPCPFIKSFFPIWHSSQTKLDQVIRWQHPKNLNGRKQSTMGHTVSLSFLGAVSLPILKKHNPTLDDNLILTSLIIHDFSEGELNRDILLNNKSEAHDLAEYIAFSALFRECQIDAWQICQKAFLLQFANKNYESFPQEAQKIMEEIKTSSPREMAIFNALERYDYILYAIETFVTNNNLSLLQEVATKHLPVLADLRAKIMGFEKIWTNEIEDWLTRIVNQKTT